ncbi:MAG: hypothetical protein H0T75_21570 [Rhizobiales bacterium]|nr:hypothetical protein [Hyphomicrobiales bacterium]
MTDVWIIHHVRELEEENDDVLLIGIYSSFQKAEAAVSKLKAAPGFREHPEEFQIEKYTLDEAHWNEGFITVELSHYRECAYDLGRGRQLARRDERPDRRDDAGICVARGQPGRRLRGRGHRQPLATNQPRSART